MKKSSPGGVVVAPSGGAFVCLDLAPRETGAFDVVADR